MSMSQSETFEWMRSELERLRTELQTERAAHAKDIRAITEAAGFSYPSNGLVDLIANLRKQMENETNRRVEAEAAHERTRAELERYASIEGKSHLQTLTERDEAEEALSQMYFLITGRSPEWSNLFGHQHAIEDVDDAQKCLRAEIKQLEAELESLRAERK